MRSSKNEMGAPKTSSRPVTIGRLRALQAEAKEGGIWDISFECGKNTLDLVLEMVMPEAA